MVEESCDQREPDLGFSTNGPISLFSCWFTFNIRHISDLKNRLTSSPPPYSNKVHSCLTRHFNHCSFVVIN